MTGSVQPAAAGVRERIVEDVEIMKSLLEPLRDGRFKILISRSANGAGYGQK